MHKYSKPDKSIQISSMVQGSFYTHFVQQMVFYFVFLIVWHGFCKILYVKRWK